MNFSQEFRSSAKLQQSSKQRIPHTKALQNRIVLCPWNLVAYEASFCDRVLEEVKLSLLFPFLSIKLAVLVLPRKVLAGGCH